MVAALPPGQSGQRGAPTIARHRNRKRPLEEVDVAAAFKNTGRQGVAETRAILRSADEVVPLVEAVTTLMEAAGYLNKDVFDLRLALEEAIINAVKHGNRSDPGKRVVVRYSVTVERVLAEIEDQGPGFDPTCVPDPTAEENLERSCGRGLLLIRYYTTWARYNERGNCLTLCKQPSAPLKNTGCE
jgi:serine/threonine-protein kinase RsbW